MRNSFFDCMSSIVIDYKFFHKPIIETVLVNVKEFVNTLSIERRLNELRIFFLILHFKRGKCSYLDSHYCICSTILYKDKSY